MASGESLIAIGKCGAPHGVRGQMRVKSYTGDPRALGTYGPLHLAGGRTLAVADARWLKQDMLVVSFAGVSSREAAAALSGLELLVPRSALPPEGEEEFYHADLIGLVARGEDGADMGKIAAVLNFGAGDILEITPASGGEALLLPFTQKTVPKINLKSGYLTLVLPNELEGTEFPG